MGLLQEKSMLVSVSIKVWQPYKGDKRADGVVSEYFTAEDAGRFSKRLLDKKDFAQFNNFRTKLDRINSKYTYPWDVKGVLLLPISVYKEYMAKVSEAKMEFDKMVQDFIFKFPSLIQDRKSLLGSLFDPSDYPTRGELNERFAFDVKFMPVPAGNDFRAMVSDEEAERIRVKIDNENKRKEVDISIELLNRIAEPVKNLVTILSRDKTKIFESLLGNIVSIIDSVPAMNISNDERVNKLAVDIKKSIMGLTTDILKTNHTVRANVINNMSAILDRIGGE